MVGDSESVSTAACMSVPRSFCPSEREVADSGGEELLVEDDVAQVVDDSISVATKSYRAIVARDVNGKPVDVIGQSSFVMYHIGTTSTTIICLNSVTIVHVHLSFMV